MKYRLKIAYDGTGYHGWQKQAHTGETIQQILEEVLTSLTGERVYVICSGRTDAGVHALGQVALIELQRPFEAYRLRHAINALLPKDIIIREVQEAPEDFHPRFQAKAKHYRYLIYNHKVRNLFYRNYSWHLPYDLDIDKMQAECSAVLGTHDFSAFKAQGCTRKVNVKTIYSASFSTYEAWVVFDIIGDGFLKQMVRTIVGSIVYVGRGRREPGFLAKSLAGRKRASAGETAPARGLSLVNVFYEGENLPEKEDIPFFPFMPL